MLAMTKSTPPSRTQGKLIPKMMSLRATLAMQTVTLFRPSISRGDTLPWSTTGPIRLRLQATHNDRLSSVMCSDATASC